MFKTLAEKDGMDINATELTRLALVFDDKADNCLEYIAYMHEQVENILIF